MNHSATSAISTGQSRAWTHASTPGAVQIRLEHSVVRLKSWPNLSRLPPELIPDTARVCALLAVRPTGFPLVHVLLSLPREQVAGIIGMLQDLGHLTHTASTCTQESIFTQQLGEHESRDPIREAAPASFTLVQRLWRRLTAQTG